jgi:hypothetical protein
VKHVAELEVACGSREKGWRDVTHTAAQIKNDWEDGKPVGAHTGCHGSFYFPTFVTFIPMQEIMLRCQILNLSCYTIF